MEQQNETLCSEQLKVNEKRLAFCKQQREKHPQTWAGLTPIPLEWVRLAGKERRVEIYPGVIFSEHGFGFVWDGSEYLHIPHTGVLHIEDGVEIFPGTNIVRPTLEPTRIGEGTKIDYNCHIAHNVNIGKHCLIIAGTVIGGSVTIGDNCYLGIGCMIRNKVKIGNGVTIGMGAVVVKDVPDGVTVVGNPARILTK